MHKAITGCPGRNVDLSADVCVTSAITKRAQASSDPISAIANHGPHYFGRDFRSRSGRFASAQATKSQTPAKSRPAILASCWSRTSFRVVPVSGDFSVATRSSIVSRARIGAKSLSRSVQVSAATCLPRLGRGRFGNRSQDGDGPGKR